MLAYISGQRFMTVLMSSPPIGVPWRMDQQACMFCMKSILVSFSAVGPDIRHGLKSPPLAGMQGPMLVLAPDGVQVPSVLMAEQVP